MGYAMAERLAKGGCDLAVWNRTKEKAEPLAKYGAKVVNQLEELSTRDILFVMVSTYEDVKEVIGKALAGRGKPKMVVECSSISLDGSAAASHDPSAWICSFVTFAPSSVRSRFSSRTLRLNGSLS